MTQAQIKSGDDVTRLMNLKSGEDVTDLINGTTSEPVSKPEVKNEPKVESGFLSKVWNTLSSPLTNIPSDVANYLADKIDIPSLERSPLAARAQGFIAGAGQGIGNIATSLTSPIDLGALLLSGGSSLAARGGLNTIAKGMALGSKALSAPVAAHGASEIAQGNPMGIAEIAGGVAGMRQAVPMPKIAGINNVADNIVNQPIVDTPITKDSPFFTKNNILTDEQLLKQYEPIHPDWKSEPSIISDLLRDARKYGVDISKFNDLEDLDNAVSNATPGMKIQDYVNQAETEIKNNLNKVRPMDLPNDSSKTIDINSKSTKLIEAGEIPPTRVGTIATMKDFTIAKYKKALEEGYVFDSLTDDGKYQMRYTGVKTQQPILETEVGNIRPTTRNINKLGPINDAKKTSIASEVLNLPRAVMASNDFSAPLRQGLPLIHKKQFWTSLDDMFKAYGSEEAFREIQQSIADKPLFRKRVGAKGEVLPSFADDAGLKLTDLTDLNSREEALMSTWAEKVPGVRRSNRAYTAFINKLRADTFESLIDSGKVFNPDVESNIALAKEIGKFVNTATGRGDLGALESSAVALNSTFFAPRLIASRVQMLNPHYYITADPFVRKEALKSLLAVVGTGTAVGQLAKMAGAEVGTDSNSSDFGKIKIGDVRLDPFAGFQQYAVLASKMISGKASSSVTGNTYKLGAKFGRDTRLDVAGRFVDNKLNPVLNFATGMLRGKNALGQPFDVPEEIASRFTPIFLQDLKQLLTENPKLIPFRKGGADYEQFMEHLDNLPFAVPAAFGMGMQQYDKR